MRVLIRTDASVRIGAGHVMRCLALAGELKHLGAEVCFVCCELPGHLCDWIEQRGFTCRRLPPVVIAADALPWQLEQTHDAQAVTQLAGSGWDWCVVDHYGLSRVWQQSVRAISRHLLAIDDAATRPQVVDLLLDQNLDWQYHAAYASLLPPAAQTLLGPRYALLRPEFAVLHRQARPRQKLDRILVAFGGGDADNETGRVVSLLGQMLQRSFTVAVVITAAHPARKQLENACLEYGFELAVQVEDMARRMAQADLAIGAAGVIAWERCCLGLPALMITLADNQNGIAAALHATGAAIALGKVGVIDGLQLARALEACQRPGVLAAMSESALSLVDGLGAGRVAQAMASL